MSTLLSPSTQDSDERIISRRSTFVRTCCAAMLFISRPQWGCSKLEVFGRRALCLRGQDTVVPASAENYAVVCLQTAQTEESETSLQGMVLITIA